MDVDGPIGAATQGSHQVRSEEQFIDVVTVEDIDVEAVHQVIDQVDGPTEVEQVGRP